MITKQKILSVEIYIETYLRRFGYTSLETTNFNISCDLSNQNDEADNVFKVDSEKEALVIAQKFVKEAAIEDIFKNSKFDETKQLFLWIQIQLTS